MGHLLKIKMRRFKGECAHFSFNKCPINTQDDSSAKFSTNSHETDNSVNARLDSCIEVKHSSTVAPQLQNPPSPHQADPHIEPDNDKLGA